VGAAATPIASSGCNQPQQLEIKTTFPSSLWQEQMSQMA